MSLKNFKELLFSSILLLSPAFLGKHFILPSSYVRGVLVNYLVPTLYLTDILLGGLFLAWGIEAIRTAGLKAFVKPYPLALILLFLSFLLSALWAPDTAVALTGTLRLGLYLFFAWFVSRWFRRSHLTYLAIAVFASSLLAILQFILQRQIFGYFFFGEPVLSVAAYDVVKINFFGRSLIAPYATFPHPNVLGGFLAVCLTLLFAAKILRRTKIFLGAVGIPALFLTLSFSAWTAFFLGISALIGAGRKNLRPFLGILAVLVLFLAFIIQAESEPLSIKRRGELAAISLKMFAENPLGVGMGNFSRLVPEYGIVSGTAPFYQPVHNLFLLIASEAGILGFFSFLYLLRTVLERLRKKPAPYRRGISSLPLTYGILFVQVLILGLFDHYLLTVPQGLFVFSLTLGLCFLDNKR